MSENENEDEAQPEVVPATPNALFLEKLQSGPVGLEAANQALSGYVGQRVHDFNEAFSVPRTDLQYAGLTLEGDLVTLVMVAIFDHKVLTHQARHEKTWTKAELFKEERPVTVLIDIELQKLLGRHGELAPPAEKGGSNPESTG
jgi:hypothetical protein